MNAAVGKPSAKGQASAHRSHDAQQPPEPPTTFTELLAAPRESSIKEAIHDRVAGGPEQTNGCTFCLDLQMKQVRCMESANCGCTSSPAGEPRRCSCLAGCAAPAWTEILTRLPDLGVPGEIYDRVQAQLPEREISDLTS